jgi:hypothetical protein
VDCAVVHRLGNLQAEVIRIDAATFIPSHVHPGVDSIDLLVAGDIDLVVSGKRIAEGYSKGRREAFLKRAGIRIAQDAPHGGSSGEEPVVFVSVQRWAMAPTHIGYSWKGTASSPTHERILDELAGRVK